jgi:hypothetical protein
MMRSGRMPRRIHHTANRESPPAASVEKGAPLSVRIACGNPNSRKADSKTTRVCLYSGRVNAWHRSRYRLNPSMMVTG